VCVGREGENLANVSVRVRAAKVSDQAAVTPDDQYVGTGIGQRHAQGLCVGALRVAHELEWERLRCA
jgi:hypothetical protein